MASIEMERIVPALQCDDPTCARRRNGTRKHTVHCPAHADKRPSLSLAERDGKVLFHCFAGCTQDAVIKALKQKRLPEQKRLWGEGDSLKVKGVNVLMAASRQRKVAIANGWVVNTGRRKRQPMNLEPGDPLP